MRSTSRRVFLVSSSGICFPWEYRCNTENDCNRRKRVSCSLWGRPFFQMHDNSVWILTCILMPIVMKLVARTPPCRHSSTAVLHTLTSPFLWPPSTSLDGRRISRFWDVMVSTESSESDKLARYQETTRFRFEGDFFGEKVSCKSARAGDVVLPLFLPDARPRLLAHGVLLLLEGGGRVSQHELTDAVLAGKLDVSTHTSLITAATASFSLCRTRAVCCWSPKSHQHAHPTTQAHIPPNIFPNLWFTLRYLPDLWFTLPSINDGSKRSFVQRIAFRSSDGFAGREIFIERTSSDRRITHKIAWVVK